MLRRFLSLALAVAVCRAQPTAAEETVVNCSRSEPGGERTLCHETVISAPVAQVWALWATSEGLSTWAAPVAAIEARVGGMFESSYDPAGRIGADGNIRNRILAAIPNALLIMQVAAAPRGFAHEDEVRGLATVVELAPVDAEHTRVRISMLGYRAGEGFDALYRFFDWGNAWSLTKLQQRVVSGPLDWRAEAIAAQATEAK